MADRDTACAPDSRDAGPSWGVVPGSETVSAPEPREPAVSTRRRRQRRSTRPRTRANKAAQGHATQAAAGSRNTQELAPSARSADGEPGDRVQEACNWSTENPSGPND